MKDKMKKIFSVTHLNLFMIVVLVLLVAYPLFAPITPAIYDKPVVQETSSLYAGHTITYKIHTCRYVGDGALTTITRKLVSISDPSLTPIVLGTDTLTNPAGCHDSSKTLVVPYSTPAGTYQLVVSGIYQVIPLRKPITVTATSDSFYLNAATTAQDIQALIDANTQLQAQIRAQIDDQSKTTTPVQGSGSSSTNNTNNTTNNNTTPVQGSGSPASRGLIPGLINALGGGGLNISL